MGELVGAIIEKTRMDIFRGREAMTEKESAVRIQRRLLVEGRCAYEPIPPASFCDRCRFVSICEGNVRELEVKAHE